MQLSRRFSNSYFRYALETFNRKVYWFIILFHSIWCDETLKLSPPTNLKEWR